MNIAIVIMLGMYIVMLLLIGLTALMMLTGKDRQRYPK